MIATFTLPTLLDCVLQKAHEVAPVTTTDNERLDALRYFAEDVRNWLDRQPANEREALLQTIAQYLRTGTASGIPTPLDAREEGCFMQLLSLIDEPPPLLL